MGFFHVPGNLPWWIMLVPAARPWPEDESRHAQLAYQLGPNVRYPGLLRNEPMPGVNLPPESPGTIPDGRLGRNRVMSRNMSEWFVDPEGEPLTYAATSSAPDSVAVLIEDAVELFLTAKREGASTVTVTATDSGGLTAMRSFVVTVPTSNLPPEVVGTMPHTRLALNRVVTMVMQAWFVDPDGDPMTYTVSSSAPDVVEAVATNIRGSDVTLTPVGEGTAMVTVTATDTGGLTATFAFGVTVPRSNQPPGSNQPPEAVGTLPNVQLPDVDATREVDVSGAFTDPDDDALTYTASSSAPQVVTVSAVGSRVTLTGVGEGAAAIRVTATDPGGLSATQSFGVLVTAPFTDDPIRLGVTPIKAVHFTELRARINVLRREMGLARFVWTDPVLRAGVTRVRLVHLLELREALTAAYLAAGRSSPRWTDAAPAAGSTLIRAAHLTQLRAAVVALE